ncbi:suppressor protein SRP40-like [Camellia sinensis]|uniref:suppressor protein SRP40-like n=1 Tax=Camellia sinensis TaxID=4442 RepID=UPI001035FC65|nr:suppressor protein SRP40-like [Camellia sinensis]
MEGDRSLGVPLPNTSTTPPTPPPPPPQQQQQQPPTLSTSPEQNDYIDGCALYFLYSKVLSNFYMIKCSTFTKTTAVARVWLNQTLTSSQILSPFYLPLSLSLFYSHSRTSPRRRWSSSVVLLRRSSSSDTDLSFFETDCMAHSNKDLLDLELENSSSSNLESTLLVCKIDDLQQSQNSKPTPTDGKPFTSSAPKSHVMGKLKDFLGVMSEANQRLQNDAKDNVEDYDIEVLTGNESEYIEMDLMLGVADLHTPEAISAAQSAIAGYQPVISLAASSSETESESSSDDSSDGDSEDDSDDDYNDDNATATPPKLKRAKSVEDDSSSESSEKHKPKKQPKIVELS